jgi:hypothetical protein
VEATHCRNQGEEEAMKFYRNARIEEIAEKRVSNFGELLGCTLTPPIDIELYGELVLGLSINWEPIEEAPGEEVLAGLRPSMRQIVMNESRLAELEAQPGRRRLTLGHEMGHWDLFVEESKLDHPSLFETTASSIFAYRSAPGGSVEILQQLLTTSEGIDLVREINRRADNANEKRSVNRYAGAILMPRQMITDDATQIDRNSWPPLYRLAERYQVSISALCVRLEQLGLLCVSDGKPHESREAVTGQMGLRL